MFYFMEIIEETNNICSGVKHILEKLNIFTVTCYVINGRIMFSIWLTFSFFFLAWQKWHTNIFLLGGYTIFIMQFRMAFFIIIAFIHILSTTHTCVISRWFTYSFHFYILFWKAFPSITLYSFKITTYAQPQCIL